MGRMAKFMGAIVLAGDALLTSFATSQDITLEGMDYAVGGGLAIAGGMMYAVGRSAVRGGKTDQYRILIRDQAELIREQRERGQEGFSLPRGDINNQDGAI